MYVRMHHFSVKVISLLPKAVLDHQANIPSMQKVYWPVSMLGFSLMNQTVRKNCLIH